MSSSTLSSGLAVNIIRAENVGSHTEYILCSSIAGTKYPLVHRRYREFAVLWKTLQPIVEAKGECLPTLAPKRMFGQMDSNFVSKRMVALQNALEVLCYLAPAAKSNTLRVFLGLPLFEPAQSSHPSLLSANLNHPTSILLNRAMPPPRQQLDAHRDTTSRQSTKRTTIDSEHVGSLMDHTSVGSSSPEHGLCSVGMIRHSARLDEVFGCTWSDRDTRPYDTPISDYDLPTRAASKLIAYDFQAVVSSPFRRCLQTAAIIANRLGLKVLFVDNRLGEVMHQVKSAIAKQAEVNSSGKEESGGTTTTTTTTTTTQKPKELLWQYMTLDEAERIAEESGLLLRWQVNKDRPHLEESVHSFVERCNSAALFIEEAQASFDVHLLMKELEHLKRAIASMAEELANARETVARASEQLLATFCNTLGLGPNAASDRMYEIANEAEQNDMGFTEVDREDDRSKHSHLPVELAYRDALATVAPLQRSLDGGKRKQKLLQNAFACISKDNATSSNVPWSSALVVTHADLLNQRLQQLEPNALYAPRCCGWFVEDPRTNVVLGMNDCDKIM